MFQIFHRKLTCFCRRELYLLILFSLSCSLSPAQQRQFTNQQHFTVEDGLPQSYITGIVQDRDGFLWISTLDGLCRYDGRGFVTFRYNPGDLSGLATSVITATGKLEDDKLTLYYNPFQADEFDVKTFKVSKNEVRLRLNRMKDIFWKSYRMGTSTGNWFFMVKDKGIGWINYKTNKISYANTQNGLLVDDAVSAVVQSGEGKIYVVNAGGVQIGDTSRKKFRHIAFATHIKPMSDVDYRDNFSDRFFIASLPGDVIAIQQDRNIVLLEPNRKASKIIPIPEPPPGSQAGTFSLQVDAAGRLYFEDFGRIFRLDKKGKLNLLWEHTGPPERISAVCVDRTDVLWVSVNAKGLLKIDLHARHFESFSYNRSFMTDMLDRAAGGATQFPSSWGDRQNGYYFRQAADTNGNRYFCNNWFAEGVIIQMGHRGFRRFLHVLDHKFYSAMLAMADGTIWTFDQVEIAWNIWKSPDVLPQQLKADPKDFFNVELADARYIGGYIWCTTYNDGLFQMDSARLIKKFDGSTANGIMPSTLTEICPDPFDKNKFWVGSRGGGLILWDIHTGLRHVYTMKDGLPNNTIYCILPDKKGHLWCSSNKGIFRFNTTTGQITSFEKTDGLTSNEFNRAHKFLFADGRMAFGGLDGYTIFRPSDFDITPDKEGVPVILTGLLINNEAQGAGYAASRIGLPLSALTKIVLPYNRNYLRFEFAAMRFNQPQKIKYRYRLSGVDDRWVENANVNTASYAALPPGNYTFNVNAADENGWWSESVTKINITILPPFWATWWAWLVYGLLLAGVGRWYLRFRINRIRMQENLAFEKRESLRLRDMDKMKDRFFSNVTHEFRTPLTLIVTPLEQLEKDESLSAAAKQKIKTAKQNTSQLLRLINEFLDFSKLKKGQLALNEDAGELVLYISDLVAAFGETARQRNIQLDFASENISGYYLFDAEKFSKIINNLVSNALKFSRPGGKVAVALSASGDGKIRITVTDNGVGIRDDQQKKVFERFYQVDDPATRNRGGTGIGLSLVKELTDLMGGTILLESEAGIFTRFTITVPLKRAAGPAIKIEEVPLPREAAEKDGDLGIPLLLVVEDNDELRSFLAETMKKNYRVIEAANGLTGWDVILSELPDIIISDVMMPGRDGFRLCKMCKEDSRTAHIGFVLLTSRTAHESVLEGLDAGADDYISKPFSMEELELRLGNLYQLQKKQRERLLKQLNEPDSMAGRFEVSDPFLTHLFKEIDARLDDPGLGVDALCSAMAMSRSTLNRKLKSVAGTSAGDLIRKYRLQKAAGFLSDGMDIASSAYNVGFSSPSYFSQCFKEQYGITPSQWISEHS